MLKSKRFNTAATIILTVLVIITLLPLALIVISSFTKESALIRNGYSFWPQEWSLDAYYYMIKQGAVILRSYGVSVFVTAVGTAASVICPAIVLVTVWLLIVKPEFCFLETRSYQRLRL